MNKMVEIYQTTFQMHLLERKYLIILSLKFVPKGAIDNKKKKTLPEPMMTDFIDAYASSTSNSVTSLKRYYPLVQVDHLLYSYKGRMNSSVRIWSLLLIYYLLQAHCHNCDLYHIHKREFP